MQRAETWSCTLRKWPAIELFKDRETAPPILWYASTDLGLSECILNVVTVVNVTPRGYVAYQVRSIANTIIRRSRKCSILVSIIAHTTSMLLATLLPRGPLCLRTCSNGDYGPARVLRFEDLLRGSNVIHLDRPPTSGILVRTRRRVSICDYMQRPFRASHDPLE